MRQKQAEKTKETKYNRRKINTIKVGGGFPSSAQ